MKFIFSDEPNMFADKTQTPMNRVYGFSEAIIANMEPASSADRFHLTKNKKKITDEIFMIPKRSPTGMNKNFMNIPYDHLKQILYR